MGPYPLDPHHSHFVLVDDGRDGEGSKVAPPRRVARAAIEADTPPAAMSRDLPRSPAQDAMGKEVDLRTGLEEKICTMAHGYDDDGKELAKPPMVCLVVGGGFASLSTVLMTLQHNRRAVQGFTRDMGETSPSRSPHPPVSSTYQHLTRGHPVRRPVVVFVDCEGGGRDIYLYDTYGAHAVPEKVATPRAIIHVSSSTCRHPRAIVHVPPSTCHPSQGYAKGATRPEYLENLRRIVEEGRKERGANRVPQLSYFSTSDEVSAGKPPSPRARAPTCLI